MAGEGIPVIVFLSGYGANIDASWSLIFPQVPAPLGCPIASRKTNHRQAEWTFCTK
jgi:hypothetical protein